MKFVLNLLLTAVIVIITAYLLPGVHVSDFLTAIIVAFVLALLNGFLKPVLVFLTIPITILTFGLFLLVINAIIILLAGSLVSGFYVDGFLWALLFSLIMSLLSYLLGVKDKRNRE
ncbi:MAG: phage holin family protein [Bacteroidales bacterium]|nr:phage holin family protein [Bacteroidales bacterium]